MGGGKNEQAGWATEYSMTDFCGIFSPYPLPHPTSGKDSYKYQATAEEKTQEKKEP